MSFDVAIVGSGHNGLITAAYLAKAGMKVAVFERRPIVGGAVCTQEDLIPGYKIDVGSSAHIMIHQTPVLSELALDQFGLEYIEMDPWACYPLADGSGRALYFYRDIAKTCESIATISPKDAEAYQRFCEAWGDLNEGVFQAFLRAPTPLNLVRGMMGRSLKGSNRTNMVRQLLAPYGQLVCEWFEHEALRTAMIWLAAQSGPPPSEPGSGDFAGWHAMYHRSGMKRAKGGSGALTQALKQRILKDGGSIYEDTPVERILTSGNGRVLGVETVAGEHYQTDAVVAACHIKTTIEQLLRDANDFPNGLRVRCGQLRIGNGFGMIIRCATDRLPAYEGIVSDPLTSGDACHQGLQLLCPSRQALDHAYADYLTGRPPQKPIPLAMTFSALDPSIAPAGKHTLFIWGQYHPYELANGEHWDTIREREADKLIAAVERYAPGTASAITNRYIQTPLDIERLHGMYRGNVMHLEMSIDQMFTFRPMPELSSYKVPQIKGLYLTGSSTHPGGGVWGASGYNTAQIMLREKHKWR